MKTKLAVLSVMLLALGGSLFAQVGQQGIASNPLGGDLTATSASCATVQSCVWMRLPSNGSTATVTLAGTFVQTDLIELSGDGGNTWTTNTTLSAVGITSVTVSGFSDIRVRCSAFTSGRASVTINVGLLQVQSVVAGGSSSASPSNPAAPMGYYLSSAGKDLGITNPFVFGTPANTQRSTLCNYTLGSTTVTCRTAMATASASVNGSNVATYTFPANIVASWAVGNSITVTQFIGGDTFFNQTCTLSAVAAQSVSCPLTHAVASSTTFGVVTNTSAGPFTAFDAGTGNPNGAKRIDGYQNCTADNGITSVNNNSPLVTTPTTISAFVSSLQVTISQTALFSAPNANLACITWGNPDDTAAAAMDLAMMSALQCPRGHLAAGYYWYNVPHHFGQPDACNRLPGEGGSAGGNLTYPAGFEWDGRGNGTTVIHMPPGFPESGPGCVNGLSKKGCFVVTLEGKVSNVMIEGGGNYNAPNIPANTNLMEVDGPATLEYFTCVNFASTGTGATGGTVGIGMYLWAQPSFINNSGCGDWGIATGVNTVSVTAFRMVVENPRGFAYNLGVLTDYASFPPNQHSRYNFFCIDCWAEYNGLSGNGLTLMRVGNAQSIKLVNAHFTKYIGGLAANNIIGLQMFGGAGGGNIDIQDSYLDMTSAGTATSTGDIGISDQAGYTVHIENSIVKGTSGGNGYSGIASSKFNSLGGNTLGGMSVNAGGLLSLNPTDNLSVATGVTPTCPTVTGATATCAAVAGSTNEKGTLRMTVSAAGTAAGTVTMNFVGTFQQTTTPSCTFNPALTGTGAWNARATTFLSTRSSTAPIITWDNNAANLGNLTWDIDYTCTLR